MHRARNARKILRDGRIWPRALEFPLINWSVTVTMSARKRSGAAAASRPVEDEESADAAASAALPAEAAAGDATAPPRPSNRAAAAAQVARNRAAFFARGGGEGAAQRGEGDDDDGAIECDDGDDDDDVGATDDQPQESWPGPWSTARQLLRDRAAVRAAREEGGDDALPASVAAAPGSNSRPSGSAGKKRKGRDIPATVGASEPTPMEQLRASFAPTWQSAWRGGGVDGGSDIASPTGANNRRGGSGGGDVSAPATSAAPTRRALAVAGPSGVRIGVPPLTILCLETLVGYISHIEELGGMSSSLRRKFAACVCRHRAMDNDAFLLFATECGEELAVPDCAGVDEAHMISGLQRVGRGLESLALGHCGRGLTPRALAAVAPKVLRGLTSLSLVGAHVLTDAAIEAALTCTPLLTHLKIASSPVVEGAFLAALPTLTPLLERLELDGVNLVGDAALCGGRVGKGGGGEGVAAEGDGGLGGSGGGGAESKNQKKPVVAAMAVATSPSVAAVAASLSSSAAVPVFSVSPPLPHGGILLLRRLSALSVGQMPLVTDAFFTSLLGAGRARATNAAASLPSRREAAAGAAAAAAAATLLDEFDGGNGGEDDASGGGASATFTQSASSAHLPATAAATRLTSLSIDRCPGVTHVTIRAVVKSGLAARLTTLQVEGQQNCGGPALTAVSWAVTRVLCAICFLNSS